MLVDGIHDLGGMQGLGAVDHSPAEPVFCHRWEAVARALLAEMGWPLAEEVEIRVWDSSAEVRYLVLPQRPPATEGMTAAELAGLVTRDSMIGVAGL